MPDELWTEVHDIVQETGIKTIPKKKKCQKAKWLSEEALQIAVKRREVKSKGEKERYTHLNAEKAFLSNQYKEIEENNRMGKTRDLFKKISDIQGIFHVKIKDRNCMNLREAEKAMAAHSSTLAWKIPWMEEPGGLQSMGSLGVRHD